MDYEFYTVDVFTDVRFGGNQLAVLIDAEGISDADMQRIAAEFNYSECTFVLPPSDPENACKVRIFTPDGELPFAGHPNVGTAHVLAKLGRLGTPSSGMVSAHFEELSGLVDVRVAVINDLATIEIRAPRGLDLEIAMTNADAASLVGIETTELGEFSPRYAESGVGYVLIEVSNADVLARLHVDAEQFAAIHTGKTKVGIYAFTRTGVGPGNDIRARMFAPLQGIAEDPATGSAACVLAASLANATGTDGKHQYLLEQGIEMGRPSHLSARATVVDGKVDKIHLYGQCVDVMRGTLSL